MENVDIGESWPPEVRALAERRAQARADRDFAAADALRAEIDAAGWRVLDTAEGWELSPKPAYDVLATVAALPDNTAATDRTDVTVSLLVEGWPDDVRTCLDALLTHTTATLQVLDNGDVDGCGALVDEYARAHPDRLEAWHVERAAGWGEARTALLRADTAAVHVWWEISTIADGDAVTPLLRALDDATVVAAGWQGVNVDTADAWRSFGAAGAGEVDALLGYLFAVRRAAALAVGGPHPKARYYRNADLEFSLALREHGGRLVAVPDLPVHQGRHHGYHDVDPAYREKESAKTFNRLLQRFRGREELLAPRGQVGGSGGLTGK